MNILNYDNSDEGKIFKRIRWTDIFFSWNRDEQRYIYCDKNGTFKPAHHAVNRGHLSRVGQGVLDSDDIIELTEENIMIKNVNYAGKDYGVVAVVHGVHEFENGKFPSSSKPYMFKTDSVLAFGDVVVFEDKNGYGIGTVVEYYDNTFENAKIISMAKAWIVDEVIMTKHRQKQESAARIKYIKEQLEERKQNMEEMQVYEVIAKNDKAAAKLLKELKELS